MPTYDFTFPAALAGQTVTVFDALGNGVGERELTAVGDEAIASFDLPTGTYEAKVNAAAGEEALSVQDDASIAASGGGGGAAETAKFIGTATCDTSGDTSAVTFAVDGTPVDWSSTDGDTITIDGPVFFTIRGRQGGTLDFSAATGFSTAHASPYIEGFLNYAQGTDFGEKNCFNDQFIPLDAPGDSFDIDAVLSNNGDPLSNSGNADGVTVYATIAAHGYDENGDPVTDGTYDATFAVWITRETNLPTLPA